MHRLLAPDRRTLGLNIDEPYAMSVDPCPVRDA